MFADAVWGRFIMCILIAAALIEPNFKKDLLSTSGLFIMGGWEGSFLVGSIWQKQVER